MFCTIDKILLAYKFKFTVHMCCWFAVCPVPMTKEEEEFIKQRETNRELMKEIAREIEMTCLGKLKKIINNNNNKNLVEQVLPRELRALLNS